jgi:hypothetical protein
VCKKFHSLYARIDKIEFVVLFFNLPEQEKGVFKWHQVQSVNLFPLHLIPTSFPLAAYFYERFEERSSLVQKNMKLFLSLTPL